MATEDGPNPEDVEEGRKAAYTSGLQAVRFALEDLAEEFQRLEARPSLIGRARILEPLLTIKLGLDYDVPVLVDPDAPDGEKTFASRHVFVRFARVDPTYSILSEQAKIVALCAGFTEDQTASVKKDLAGKMSLLMYNTRAAFRTFANTSVPGGDSAAAVLRDIMGGSVDDDTRGRVLAGAFTIDPEEMTLRVVEKRYGMVVEVLSSEGAGAVN